MTDDAIPVRAAERAGEPFTEDELAEVRARLDAEAALEPNQNHPDPDGVILDAYLSPEEGRRLLATLDASRTPAAPLRRFSEALDSAVQAALPATRVADKVWQDRDERWVPLAAIESAAAGLPCPMRSSLTDQPCILAWGHEPAGDDPPRFHKFAPPSPAAPETPEPERTLRRALERLVRASRNYTPLYDYDAAQDEEYHAALDEAEAALAQPQTAEDSGISIDANVLGWALDRVDEEDAKVGVVGRGRKADRVVAEYRRLATDSKERTDG